MSKLDEKLTRLITYIAEECEGSSSLLGPVTFSVECTTLLDGISEIYGVEKSDIGEIVNRIADRKEKEHAEKKKEISQG